LPSTGVGRSLSETDLDSAVDVGAVELVDFGFEGIETVANPRAGLVAGFFFFLLLGGILAGRMLLASKERCVEVGEEMANMISTFRREHQFIFKI
jgi:hypothetical protein